MHRRSIVSRCHSKSLFRHYCLLGNFSPGRNFYSSQCTWVLSLWPFLPASSPKRFVRFARSVEVVLKFDCRVPAYCLSSNDTNDSLSTRTWRKWKISLQKGMEDVTDQEMLHRKELVSCLAELVIREGLPYNNQINMQNASKVSLVCSVSNRHIISLTLQKCISR